ADNMGYRDLTYGEAEPYSPEAVYEAYENDRVVLIAGGTGFDGSTTDDAVLDYAARHKTHKPDDEVMVFKGTTEDGVFTADPKKFGDAERYSRISAHTMLAEYGRYNCVDQSCLERICDTGIGMYVYGDGQHDLITVIESCANGSDIGTFITAEEIEPVLA